MPRDKLGAVVRTGASQIRPRKRLHDAAAAAAAAAAAEPAAELPAALAPLAAAAQPAH